MKQEKQQAIALMRYGAIAPLIAGLDEDYPSKTAFYMELSTKGLVGPSKNGIWIIRTTGLMPLSRKDALMQV